jgi:hypothetical protein
MSQDRTPNAPQSPGRAARVLARTALALALLAPAGRAWADTDDCPDALITADVKSRLMARHPVAALNINVDTDQCFVTLKGCAENQAQIKDAARIARKVKKVKGVKSLLSVCPKDN